MGGGAGAGQDKIVKPGYHIRPQYDLHGLRRRRTNEHKGHVVGELPLVSLIDVFSVLVIYLLMNFSATGEMFFMPKNLPLPKAIKASPLESAPLISIIGDKFLLEAHSDFEFSPFEDSSPELTGIANSLKGLLETEKRKNLGIGNRINLQAAEDTDLGMIKRAMAAAVSAGWTNVNFVVEKPKEK